MNIQTKQILGEHLNELNSLKWNITWKFMRKGQKVGEELKDVILKYFSNIQRTHFSGQLWAGFQFFGAHTQ